MNDLPKVTVAPALGGGWLLLCSHCPELRQWTPGERRPLDELAIEHRAQCATKRRS